MNSVAFNVYLEFVPARGLQRNPVRFPSTVSGLPGSTPVVTRGRRSGRFDVVRDAQRLSVQVWEALDAVVGIEMPIPGGNQNTLYGRLSNMSSGTGISPQFGNSPHRFMIEGFVNMSEFSVSSEQPDPETIAFHGNEVQQGVRGPQPWLGPAGNPTIGTEEEVAVLKKTIELAIVEASIVDDTGSPPRVFRLYYKGSIWGDRGHHFPDIGL